MGEDNDDRYGPHEETVGTYMNRKHELLRDTDFKYKRFMASFYESKDSKSLDRPVWMPTMDMDLPDPREKKDETIELLANTTTEILDNHDSVEEKVQLLNWAAYVRDQDWISTNLILTRMIRQF